MEGQLALLIIQDEYGTHEGSPSLKAESHTPCYDSINGMVRILRITNLFTISRRLESAVLVFRKSRRLNSVRSRWAVIQGRL